MNATHVDWVIGRFEGIQAKSVEAHASAGIGYIVIDSFGSGSSKTIVAAFRKPSTRSLSNHLTRITDPNKIRKYEEMLKSR